MTLPPLFRNTHVDAAEATRYAACRSNGAEPHAGTSGGDNDRRQKTDLVQGTVDGAILASMQWC
jgi:hypothetical protein